MARGTEIAGAQQFPGGQSFDPATAGARPANQVPLIESGSGAIGSSRRFAREDHVHPATTSISPATATPLVESGSGAVGTAVKYAREDHVHPAASGSGSSPSLNLITANTTLTQDITKQFVCIFDTTTARTLTLPSGASQSQVVWVWVNQGPAIGNHTVAANTGDTVSGSASLTVNNGPVPAAGTISNKIIGMGLIYDTASKNWYMFSRQYVSG